MSLHLILMLKYPKPGEVKTRLVPALGETQACELYKTMVRHTLKIARQFVQQFEVTLRARVAHAPDDRAVREWLGDDIPFRPQAEGDLGVRMENALTDSFTDGAAGAIVIGGDCPELSVQHLEQALRVLQQKELVLGPAIDGGYYLIGLRGFAPALFRKIAWSTDTVLAETLAIADREGLRYELLEVLHDIDLPEDLVHWKTSLANRAGRNDTKENRAMI